MPTKPVNVKPVLVYVKHEQHAKLLRHKERTRAPMDHPTGDSPVSEGRRLEAISGTGGCVNSPKRLAITTDGLGLVQRDSNRPRQTGFFGTPRGLGLAIATRAPPCFWGRVLFVHLARRENSLEPSN